MQSKFLSSHFPQMKFNLLRLPSWKNSPFKSSNNAMLFISTLILLTIIHIYVHTISPLLLRSLEIDINVLMPLYQDQERQIALPLHSPGIGINSYDSNRIRLGKKCNMFKGNWVPYPNGPYYTNETKCIIDNRQNCLKFGRPDTDFMKWRWKPDECELPLFDAAEFLELVRGKAMAFVGDSVARNQMQSLICLLASVTRPLDISYLKETSENFFYTDYNFTLSHLWTTHLIKAYGVSPFDKNPSNLTLDEADESWAAQIENYDYVIFSAGHWFMRPLSYYEKGKLVGCHKCDRENATDLTMSYAYRMAFRTAFRTLLALPSFKGVTFLRTITGSHVDHRGGDWSEKGNCGMKKPFTRREMELGDDILKLYFIQVEELRAAEREGRKRGLKFRLLNITEPMALRPDGHPNHYGHWPHEKVRSADCLHWCLPGPVDIWNEILLQMMKMESKRSVYGKSQ